MVRKAKATAKTKKQNPVAVSLEQEDPTGRLDVLAARMIDHVATNTQDFPLRALYSRFKPAVQDLLRRHLGPINLSEFGGGTRS